MRNFLLGLLALLAYVRVDFGYIWCSVGQRLWAIGSLVDPFVGKDGDYVLPHFSFTEKKEAQLIRALICIIPLQCTLTF